MALDPLGWTPVFFSEIDPFACAVLKHHYPTVPNYGNMVDYKEWPDATLDVLIAGTPCQDFSIAGLRAGIGGARGNLTLAFLGVVERFRPRVVLWENVPGVLSVGRGRAFGAFLGGLAQLGYGFAHRLLDAQFFGVPQRRERIFVVAHSGTRWQRSAAVLFERESLSRNPPPRREPREISSEALEGGADLGRGGELVSGTLQAAGKAAGTATLQDAEAGLLIPTAYGGNNQAGAIEVATAVRAHPSEADVSSSITAKTHGSSTDRGTRIVSATRVRRIMPVEAERLQGFPDGYTAIPYRGSTAKDAPRYRALGNSMAVPVIRWLGERIQMVDSL